jgi:hypothetical protein
MRINLGAVASSVANKFIDSFNRTDNPTDLGRADDGSLWKVLRGAWQVSTNKAYSPTAATSVPAASVTVPGKNLTVDMITTDNGAGALLWVTDANNWWAVDVYQDIGYVCNASAPYYAFAGYYSYYYCQVPNYSSYCNAYARGTCNGYNHAYYKNGTYCQAYNFNCSGGYYSYVSGCQFGQTTTNTNYTLAGYYCTSSSAVYPRYLRVVQMAAGTLTSIASVALGNSATVNSVRALLTGNQITARAYTDNLTTQVGSDLVYTATGATLTTQYGVVITPSNSGQGNTIDSLTITRTD